MDFVSPKRFCADCIVTESLDELTDLVVPLFSLIPNRGLDPRPTITTSPWGPDQMGVRPFRIYCISRVSDYHLSHLQSVVFVKTVKDYFAFSLTFQIPDQTNNFRTQPARYLSHLVGHEGPGSVRAYLRCTDSPPQGDPRYC